MIYMVENENKDNIGIALVLCFKCKHIQQVSRKEWQDLFEKTIRSGPGCQPQQFTCPQCGNNERLVKLDDKAELQAKYQRDLEMLQELCPHPAELISPWLDEYWAVAHSTGHQVKVCRYCGDEIDRKVHCQACQKELTNYQWIRGGYNGEDNIPSEVGGFGMYCKECWDKIPTPKVSMDKDHKKVEWK